MPIDSELFLDVYAKVLYSFDPKRVASFCLRPTIIMNDKGKKVINTEEELEKFIHRIFEKLNQAGIKTFVPKLQQILRLSGTLFFSKMRWQFFDEQEQLCFGCSTSYTFQKMSEHQLKIIVAIIDNDENKLADILPSMSDL
jgi:hypothetical protein